MADMPAKTLAQFFEMAATAPLQLHSVVARGIPQQERVYLRANARTYLGDYFLFAGTSLVTGRAIPIPNLSLWLGEDTIDAGAWVIIYTGPGEHRLMTQTKDTKEVALVMHWNVPTTIFADPRMVPILVKVDRGAIYIGAVGG